MRAQFLHEKLRSPYNEHIRGRRDLYRWALFHCIFAHYEVLRLWNLLENLINVNRGA